MDKVRRMERKEHAALKGHKCSQWNSRTRFLEWFDGMCYKAQTTVIPNGIARICNAVVRPAGRFKNRVLEFRWVYTFFVLALYPIFQS